jgi:hypothetical protein
VSCNAIESYMVEKLKSAELTFKELQLKMGDPEVAGESHSGRVMLAGCCCTGLPTHVVLFIVPMLRLPLVLTHSQLSLRTPAALLHHPITRAATPHHTSSHTTYGT